MMKTRASFLALPALLAAALMLSACSSVKKELGVGRNSPDEFTVVKRAPLTLPPDYEVRPPMDPNAPPPPQQSATVQAKQEILGKESGSPAVADKAEQAFLARAGAEGAKADIRKTIDEENGYISLKNKPVAEKLIFWNDEDGAEASADHMPSSVVDPVKEKERLEKNKEEGVPVNTGTVPVIEKKKSTIDKIF